MSAYNIRLKPSKTSQRLLQLLAVFAVLLIATTPMSFSQALLAAVPLTLFYWHWYARLQQQKQTVTFTISGNGELHWVDAPLRPGLLSGKGLISQYLLRLSWQSADNTQRYCKWVWADQCTDNEYRALARVLNQHNWRCEPVCKNNA